MRLHGCGALHRAVLTVLRPAESAVRRLIIVAARKGVVKLAPSRPMSGDARSEGWREQTPSIQLYDPREALKPCGAMKSAARPRNRFIDYDPGGGSVSRTPLPWQTPAAARWPGIRAIHRRHKAVTTRETASSCQRRSTTRRTSCRSGRHSRSDKPYGEAVAPDFMRGMTAEQLA